MRKDQEDVIVLQHVANEHCGTIAHYLKRNKISFKVIALYEGKKIPRGLTNTRAVIIMGGPMNVYEEKKHPFLKAEDVFLKKAIKAKVPCLGICLGAQLLAKALGAKVTKARQPEIGWDDLVLTKEAKKSPLFSPIKGSRLKVLQWHEDTFEIPKGGVRLAKSKVVPNQAFRYKNFIHGFQFHLEVDKAMLKDWFKKREDLKEILAAYDSYKKSLNDITQNIYDSFFNIPIVISRP